MESIKEATNPIDQKRYAAVCVTAIALGITFYLWNKWNNRIRRTQKYIPKMESAKARIICRHWLRKSLSSFEISSQCLVDIVPEYYPSSEDIVLEYYPSSEMFEWDSRRKHRSLKISNGGTRFTVGSSFFILLVQKCVSLFFTVIWKLENALSGVWLKMLRFLVFYFVASVRSLFYRYGVKGKGHVAVASKQIFSSDAVSFIRWKMTLVKRSRGRPIRFSMGYVDASFMDGFDVNNYVGTLHQAALHVHGGCDVRDARRAMKDGIWQQKRNNGLLRTLDLRIYRMSPGDTFEMRFDFKARECKFGPDFLVCTDLPRSIYLAASVDGQDCSFETTLFECK